MAKLADLIKIVDNHHIENLGQHAATRDAINELRETLNGKADAPDRDELNRIIKEKSV